MLLNLKNYTKEVQQGKINKFDIEVESLWNSKMDNVYAEIELGGISAKTDEISLAPWGSAVLSAYLDAASLEPKDYKGNLKMHYVGKIKEEVIDVSVVEKKEFLSPNASTYLLVAIIVLLLIANIILIRHFLKKK